MSLQSLMDKVGKSNTNLHIHTTHSDGEVLPFEISQIAANSGLKLIGLVDHNILPKSKNYLEHLLNPAVNQIALVPGVEIDCIDNKVGKVHIVAYFENPIKNLFSHEKREKYFEVENLLQRIRNTNPVRVKEAVRRFNEYVINNSNKLFGEGLLSFEEVVESAIKRKNLLPEYSNTEVELIDLFGPLQKKGYFNHGRDAEKFFRENNLIPSRKEVNGFVLSCQDACRVANYLGATDIIFAHPGSNVKKVGTNCVDELIRKLIPHGLTGVEVYTPKNSVDVIQHYYNLTKEKGLVATVGGDNHTEDEVKYRLRLG